jgi:hypothetical protein
MIRDQWFLCCRQKLTSPKWNRFKGIRLRWKDKIRLNNVIWRCWHMQCKYREYDCSCFPSITTFLAEKSYENVNTYHLQTTVSVKKSKTILITGRGGPYVADHCILLAIHLPWKWRRYVPPKRRFQPHLHGTRSQKTIFFIDIAVKTSNLKIILLSRIRFRGNVFTKPLPSNHCGIHI